MASRDYQIAAVSSIWEYFQTKDGNPLIAMPTGTGKSHVISDFARGVLWHYPQQRIMCVTHVKELIEQNYTKLIEAWPTAPAGIYSAGLKSRDVHNSIIFAGIASVAKKAKEFGRIDLLMIDEAHLVSPSEETLYNKFIADLKAINPHLKVIGLTATPWRMGHGKLTEGGIFTDICFDMTGIDAFNWLIQQGYLTPLIPKRAKQELDVSGVHLRGGEFIASELQNAVDKADITRRALEEAIELGQNRKSWLIFCAGVEHSIHASDMLNDMGVSCVAIHSKLAANERDEAIEGFKSGKYRAVTNNNVLTTGFDHSLIDLILVLRPTRSAVLWVQMLGRGTRPVWPDYVGLNWHMWPPGAVASGRYNISTVEGRTLCIAEGPKQETLVLDFAANTRALGAINDPKIPTKGGKGGGEAPIKCCEVCNTYNHASVRVCAYCGAEFKFELKLKQGASSQELIKGDAPKVVIFPVSQISYDFHTKVGKPLMIRVNYYCGLRKFSETLCFEHDNYAKYKAHQWWKARSQTMPPTTCDAAMEALESVAQPTHISVWVNKTYPEIMNYCFDGSAFKTLEAMATDRPAVTAMTDKKDATAHLTDDDIPF